MENKRLEETAIVPTTEATTAIPEPTARLVEKSFPKTLCGIANWRCESSRIGCGT